MTSNENTENKRKRLIFRSGHRGTKEMDLILGSFAQKHVPQFNEEELCLYEEILLESDPDLYNWISGQETPPLSKRNAVFDLLLSTQFAQ